MKLLSLNKLKHMRLADLMSQKIVRFVWSAILDDRVCELCRSLDGKVMDATNPDYSIYKSPLHPRCRCTQIPITSDAEVIPKVDWKKPKDAWIKRYAPFWFLIPRKKKEEKIDIEPYAPEAPELVFNPDDIFSIEEYIRETELRNIEEEKQKMEVMEQEMDKTRIVYIIFFLDNKGRTILMKETEKDTEIDFTAREEAHIRKEASSYLINDGNDIIESQIEKLFKIKKR